MRDPLLVFAVLAGGCGLALALLGRRVGRGCEEKALWLAGCAVVLSGLAIAARWTTLGHGPFISLYEILISNYFSLGLVFVLLGWRIAAVRSATIPMLTLLTLLGGWALMIGPAPTQFPPSYENPWLWAHVGLGKLLPDG